MSEWSIVENPQKNNTYSMELANQKSLIHSKNYVNKGMEVSITGCLVKRSNFKKDDFRFIVRLNHA